MANGSSKMEDVLVEKLAPNMASGSRNVEDVPAVELDPSKLDHCWSICMERIQKTKNCISRVPATLRNIESNKKHFEPEVVSLGPYHHGKPYLQRMQQYKIVALKCYIGGFENIRRYYDPFKEEAVKYKNRYEWGQGIHKEEEAVKYKSRYECRQDIPKEEKEVKHKKWYEWGQGIPTDEEFSWMMFMDTCFLLNSIHELVLSANKSESNNSSDLSLAQPFTPILCITDLMSLYRDFMLTENQLPLKLLTLLMSIKSEVSVNEISGNKLVDSQIQQDQQQQQQTPSSKDSKPLDIINEFVDICTGVFWEDRRVNSSGPGHQEDEDEEHEPVHLLDCLRKKTLGKIPNKSKPRMQITRSRWFKFRSVSELKEAGIKFRSNRSNYFKDVWVYNGLFCRQLFLPSILVGMDTKRTFLNMMAYETGDGGPPTRPITSYVYLMGLLIDTKKDVKELKSEGILYHTLGSDQEVADLFNSLTTSIIPDYDAYNDIEEFLESNYKNRWRVSLANLYHTHFSSPWTTVAFLAAFTLLLLTIFQTHYTIHPRK